MDRCADLTTISPAYERYRLEHDDSTVCGRFDRLGEDGVPVSLGIMGGTFDPVHSGHLMCAERAREEFGLSAVVFMPAGQPVRKLNTFVASAEDRYIMARLATQDNAAFDVSAMEIRREGKRTPLTLFEPFELTIRSMCVSTSSQEPMPFGT